MDPSNQYTYDLEQACKNRWTTSFSIPLNDYFALRALHGMADGIRNVLNCKLSLSTRHKLEARLRRVQHQIYIAANHQRADTCVNKPAIKL